MFQKRDYLNINQGEAGEVMKLANKGELHP